MNADMAIVQAARAALAREASAHPTGRAAAHVRVLGGIDPSEPLDSREIDALSAGRLALEDEAGGWRRMARTTEDETWRAACAARAEEAEHWADGIAQTRPRAAAIGVGDLVVERETEL
jgi:hypothetical protein